MKINRISYPNNVGHFCTNVEKRNNNKFTIIKSNSNAELPNLRHYYNLTKVNPAIPFLGKNVYIVDGGNHATNMEHFAHAISKDMDTEILEVSTITNNPNMKSLKALEQQLKNLRKNRPIRNEYIAIPALASVPILNLQDQYNTIMNENKKFTPENLKANKESILEFLEKLYKNPSRFQRYIDYMDKNKQGMEYSYGVIQEINALVKAGAKVYIPSGHPQDETLKWMAEQRGLKPELYNFIATGKDKDGLIFGLHQEIKNKNWYDFNLLALSNANVVGVKGAKGAQDYMFAAYDSCITDGERGVYNFTPIRKNGQITGYSYTDEKTIEYPFDEFPANKEIANIAKFVGKKATNVLATEAETAKLKESIKNGHIGVNCADKLYKIEDIFSPTQIAAKKLNLQGEFVDKSLTLFFKKNSNGDIIFPKCDCEGSGKPSVLSMWGSCFAVFNAIARDINLEIEKGKNFSEKSHTSIYINNLLSSADFHIARGNYNTAEMALLEAIQQDRAFALANPGSTISYKPYMALGQLHLKTHNYEHAASCFNQAIHYLAKEIVNTPKMSLADIQYIHFLYNHLSERSMQYDKELKDYNNLSYLKRILVGVEPTKPFRYNEHKKIAEKEKHTFEIIKNAATIYENLAKICSYKNEYYPAKVCAAAAKDIQAVTDRGIEVLLARANGIQYIGDLYNEIKPN